MPRNDGKTVKRQYEMYPFSYRFFCFSKENRNFAQNFIVLTIQNLFYIMKKLFFIILTGLLYVASFAQQSLVAQQSVIQTQQSVSTQQSAIADPKPITPSTALDAYLNNGDRTWAWEIREQYTVGTTKAYSLSMVSQKWQGILWKHELIVFIPEKIKHDGALLFITGGAVENGLPRFVKPEDRQSSLIANIATKNQAITAVLHQTPNQPLYGGRTEDALISYTLNEFRKDGDYSWPLLFPMVKSARRAMDVVQELAAQKADTELKRFVISGASKRGWTTWLTGASQDPRVVAIAPMVIDILNLPATLTDQQKDYNYSEEIEDYVKLEIPQAVNSEFGNSIAQMIDPYSYRSRLTMPKMIFMGSNDPYWTIDAIKHYIYDIPGHNLLCYVANAEHNLGDGRKAFGSLNTFFGMTLNHTPYPSCEWNLTEKNKKITLDINVANTKPTGIVLWSADADKRDFRKSKWIDKKIESKDMNAIKVTLPYPQKGFTAFYVEIVCKDAQDNEYTFTTRTYVADTKKVHVK